MPHDLAEIDGLPSQCELAVPEARHVEVVLDQPGEVPRLAPDEVSQPDHLLVGGGEAVEHGQGVGDGVTARSDGGAGR